MIDWETLLAFAGLYILVLGVFLYNYLMSKRMMAMIKDSQRILALIEVIMDSQGGSVNDKEK